MIPPLRRRPFGALTPAELYAILALRVRVFVVEQECAYQELDGNDEAAEHVWTTGPGGEVAAYLRVLREGADTRLGRILTAPEHRGTGAGAALMRAVLDGVDGPAVLGAQVQAQGFYERLGFVVDGPGYDEDGIPHVPMRRAGMRAHSDAHCSAVRSRGSAVPGSRWSRTQVRALARERCPVRARTSTRPRPRPVNTARTNAW